MNERLFELCKLWNFIKYIHPYLAYKDIDWDAALIETIPKVQSAESEDDFADAIQQLLTALNDSATYVLRDKAIQAAEPDVQQQPFSYKTEDAILVIKIDEKAGNDWDGSIQALGALKGQLADATGVVFDLRSSGEEVSYILTSSRILNQLVTAPIYTPGQRLRFHSGFVPQKGLTSGGYYSGFITQDGEAISPSEEGKEIPVVFVAKDTDSLPIQALAFQVANQGAIVIQGEHTEAVIVRKYTIELNDQIKVAVRLSEIIYEDGTSGFVPDAIISNSPTHDNTDPAIHTALAWIRHPRKTTITRIPIPARAVPSPERDYQEMQYPTLEYRLLAAFRIWGVIHYFFPYKNLMEEDWDEISKEYIPQFEGAADALAYALVVAEMLTHLHDSHVRAMSPVLDEHFGTALPSVRVRMIENTPIITRILEPNISEEMGVEVGDIVLQVDGEDAMARIKRVAKYITASTDHRLMHSATVQFLLGSEGSQVTLTLQNPNKGIYEVKLPREGGYYDKFFEKEREWEIVKLISPNIGYADLDRLTVPVVDEMFETFKDTKAIIFDMRGYPKSTVWQIVPRLTETPAPQAAVFQRPLVFKDENEGKPQDNFASYHFIQTLPKSDQWKYPGKTVMLIDERTISQAEHTGLSFEAANGTKFIGSHTSGANGDVTIFYVPGGIRISFTGHNVSFVDGRQLQRIGIVPDLEVKPTIEGIRAGKDEVLEAAIAYLEQEIA